MLCTGHNSSGHKTGLADRRAWRSKFTVTFVISFVAMLVWLGATGVDAHAQATPTLSVVTSGTPSVSGGAVTFTATISSGPTGTVTFYDRGTLIGTGTISGTTATFTTSSLTVGVHTITAGWPGNTNYAAVTSRAISQAINNSAITTTLVISPGSVTAGTAVTLTATVKNGSTAISHGLVKFCNASAPICEDTAVLGRAQLTSAGTAMLKLRLGVGTHSINAVFRGTSTYSTSTSSAQTVTVTSSGPYSSVTTLTASGNASNYTLSGTVSGYGLSTLTGPISFLDTSNGNAQLGTASLTSPSTKLMPSTLYAAGTFPYSVAVGDFNRDGIPDIVTPATNSTVSVLLGNANGTFQAPVSYAIASGSTAYQYVAVGDFDGDGIQDLAVAGGNVNFISILLGNGDGTFKPQVSYATGTSPMGLAIGDFNGDGISDLIVCDEGGAAISLFLGNGDGTFQARVNFAAASYPQSIVTADFNGDGFLDAALVSMYDDTIVVFLGNGNGTFQPRITLQSADGFREGPDALAVGDFNGDGIVDLAVANPNNASVSIRLGNGDGTFQSEVSYASGNTPTAVKIGDFNGDGVDDLVVANSADNTLSVLFGNGDGTFQSQVIYPVSTSLRSLVVTDLNGDGVPDVLFPYSSLNDVAIMLGAQVSSYSASGISFTGTVGAHNVLASYPGDSNHSVSQSNTIALTSVNTTPTLSVAASGTPTIYGTAVTFTATISSGPTGSITFYNGASAMGTGTISGTTATFTTSTLTAGTHTITAGWAGNSTYSPVTSAAIAQVVSPAPPTLTVATSATPSNFGATVTFTTTISSGPTGTITFYDSGTSIGTATISGTTATLTTTMLAVGTHTISAAWPGNTSYGAATSGSISQVVNQANTITQVISGLNPAGYSQSIVLQALVNTKGGNPSGAVTFNDGGTVIETAPLETVNTANLVPYSQQVGGSLWTGTCGPTSNMTLNSSAVTAPDGTSTATAFAIPGTVSCGASTSLGTYATIPGGLTAGQTYTTSVWLRGASGGEAVQFGLNDCAKTGVTLTTSWQRYTYTFSSISSSIASCTSGVEGFEVLDNSMPSVTYYVWGPQTEASSNEGPYIQSNGSTQTGFGGVAYIATDSLAVGTHVITATYAGDSNTASSISPALSQTISTDTPTLEVATSGTPSTFGNSITFTAIVSSGPTGTITFYDGGTVLGTGTISGTMATFTTTALAAGTHNITASLPASADYSSVTSSAIAQIVNQAVPTLTVGTSATPSTFGGAVTFTATVSGGPTGTVTFYDGGTAIGTGTISGTMATFTTTTLSGGSHSITAKWAGNSNYSAVTANAITQTVNTVTPTLSVATSATPSTYGASVTFTATISSGPTGLVTFYDGGVSIGTSTISGTTVTFTTSGLTGGSHSITAGWTGNTNYAAVTSQAVSQVINAAPVTLNLATSATPSYYGQPVVLTATIASGATGFVTFYDGGVVIGAGAISGTTAIYTVGTLAIGTHTLTAGWAGNGNYSSATSNAVSETIQNTVLAGLGIINTLAGGGSGCSQQSDGVGDGCPAASVSLDSAGSLVFDSTGNLYFIDFTRIRMISASTGIISTVAGGGTLSITGTQSAPATNASLTSASGLAIDVAGNLYINCGGFVYKVTASTGYISLVAGSGPSETGINAPIGDGGSATSASIEGGGGLAVDPSGNIYIADGGNNRIRKVTVSTGIISTVAGIGPNAGEGSYSGDGGTATSAGLAKPADVKVDNAGNIYIAEVGSNRIRKVMASTGIISTVAGGGTGCVQQVDSTGDGCAATSAELNFPTAVTVDSFGNIYIADSSNQRIRAVSASTGIIDTVAGNGTGGFSGDGGPATSAKLFYPAGTAVDRFENVYIADGTNFRIREVNTTKTTPTISWQTPVAITYGTALSPLQLNATSSVPGTFSYSPAPGFLLTAGTYTLSVTFTPTQSTVYNPVSASVQLTVNKATPVISWPPPGNISSGSTLNAAQLDASSPVPGTFVYSPALGTVLPAGPHTLSVTMTPNDTVDYTSATATTSVTVNAATSTWDSGTITLSVNGVVSATANYAQGATPTTVAAGLAAGVTGASPVTITAVDDALYLESKQSGAVGNYSYSLQTTNYNSSFPQPSFVYPTVNGSLDGGADTNASGGQVYKYTVPSGGYDGVGNLLSSYDSVMGTWNFSYDNLHRLSSATAGTDAPAPYTSNIGCWSYDAFGNRKSQAMSTTACANNPPLMSWANYKTTNNNQISNSLQAPGGVSYDPSGDVINDGVNQYLYDADGRICAVASMPVPGITTMTGYIYDANGQRVAKGSISTWSCDPAISGFQTTNDYSLGQGGEQVTETGIDANGTRAWQHTNVYAAGKLIATYDLDGVHFYLNDPLGTRRAQTDYAGVLEQTCSGLPFGDGLACIPSTQYATQNHLAGSLQYPTEHHFTGKERDTESGNDYFGARYYASTMGRWLSPDPVIVSPELNNPQSWNKYSYAFNRPLSLTDPDGKWPSWYHTELDRNFFGNQLHWSMHDQEVIVKESANQDSWIPFDSFFDGQGTRNVRWHGMDDFWHQVGPEQAIANTESYITQSLNQAVYWQLRADYEGADCSSCHDASIKALADAEHAGQDLYSPEHGGKPWTMWGAAKHWFDERNSAMSSDADDERARAEAVYETQVIYSRYQNQLAAARKKQNGAPSWNCLVNAGCQQ